MPDDRRDGPGRPGDMPPSGRSKHLLWWVLLIISMTFLLLYYGREKLTYSEQVSLGKFETYVFDDGRASEVTVFDDHMEAKWKEDMRPADLKGDSFSAAISMEQIPDFKKMLREAKKAGKIQDYEYKPRNQLLLHILVNVLPWIVILAVVWYFLFRHMRVGGGPGSVLAFGQSRAKRVAKESTKITFDDVAGMDEAKDEVTEIIEFLKSPAKFQRLGGRVPRGVLLIGPPGTGKTLLAKAIAGEADVPFYSISGSDFVEMFVGVGASRVRDLFQRAKEDSPCIIFLDEIDAVGRRRGSGWGGGHDEREQTLNAMLVEMDGFDTDEKLIVIAATNRPDVLDPALLRPGRFDREIYIDLPDLHAREKILKVHAKKVKVSPDIDLEVIARSTPTFSGADLEAIINEAALLAVMNGKSSVGMEELEESRDKVCWGRQKRSKVMDDDDKRVTAIHESGHALAAKMLPEVEPLHKVTIIPRGMTLGSTMQLPEKDKYHMFRKSLLGNIKVLLAGRVAEELFCDDISAGAASDITRATTLARRMVCEWGMSDAMGPVSYNDAERYMLDNREISTKSERSEATAVMIDKETKKIIDTCYAETRKIIESHGSALEGIAEGLLMYESLDAAEVDEILQGKKPEDLKDLLLDDIMEPGDNE